MLFNDNWLFYKDGEKDKAEVVNVPHDAMLREGRDINNPGGANISYFGGGKYHYEKEFELSLKEGEKVFFEFEGVYCNPVIFINGQKAHERPYGYTDFIFDATSFVKEGKNTIEVIADNSNQPNSRWYTGSGIYRPVHLFILPKTHILPRSFKIKTVDYEKGLMDVKAQLSEKSNVKLEIFDPAGNLVYENSRENEDYPIFSFNIVNPQLWDLDHPNLYTAVLTIDGDQAKEHFGIRQTKLDKEKGFLLNGKRVILYGGCIHHDNGLLGAIADPFAEERRARIIKHAGYNSVRSAHNPISRAFMEACDRIGLLIMDEYVDCWYIHKTMYDYAGYCMDWYKEDLKDMVDKDYNHPSVILYSTGNEVAETSQKKGIDFVKAMTDYLHSLDSTRPVTCGINIFFNALFSLGFGVYSDKKAKKDLEKKPTAKKKSVGSEFFNKLAGLLGADFMKTGATLHICDVKTRDSFANMDVAGYNYGIKRYKHDLKKYPDRFILGSETFCADSGKFYELAQKNPRIIGDFVWAAWDYLGEAGIGSWVAASDKAIYDDKSGWLLAGSGRIDILGNECAEMKYTRTAFRQEKISLAVISPRDYAIGHSPSSWKLSWAHYGYDYPGCEGMKTEAEVYSQAPTVRLFQNDKLIGTKHRGKNPDGLYSFKIKYEPGTLKAVAYDKQNNEVGSAILMSCEKDTYFRLLPEERKVKLPDGLAYIRLWFTDQNGVPKRLVNEEIEVVEVTNGTLLGLGNACPYYKGSYLDNKTTAYYGKALAIVRPNGPGVMTFKAKTPYGEASCQIKVEEGEAKEDFHI